MGDDIRPARNSDRKQKVRLILDYIHRIMMHHAMWYAEVQRRLGPERAPEILRTAHEHSASIQMRRLGRTLGFEVEDDLPRPLLDLSAGKLEELRDALAANWLANDGMWFQAVEFACGMEQAKACNDSCWAQFSPFEAWSIKRLLEIPEKPGLEGLKEALQWRLYATLNRQSIAEETPGSFVFRMDECRVQSARKRKGLDDYPCKSAGLVEYPMFAAAIDERIRTECVGCPPDDHPKDWYCAWRFILDER